VLFSSDSVPIFPVAGEESSTQRTCSPLGGSVRPPCLCDAVLSTSLRIRIVISPVYTLVNKGSLALLCLGNKLSVGM